MTTRTTTARRGRRLLAVAVLATLTTGLATMNPARAQDAPVATTTRLITTTPAERESPTAYGIAVGEPDTTTSTTTSTTTTTAVPGAAARLQLTLWLYVVVCRLFSFGLPACAALI
jgi:hypothetical protein